MSLSFHHLAIQCANLPACERFYREVLGLKVLRRWPWSDGGDRSVWLEVGDGFIALERADRPPRPRPWRDGEPGLHLVALRIGAGERVSWEERLAAGGISVMHRTRWTLYIYDPEGNRVGLTHYPEEVVVTGVTATP